MNLSPSVSPMGSLQSNQTPPPDIPLVGACRSIVEVTETFANLNVPKTDKRERLMIEEVRFQARVLQATCKSMVDYITKISRTNVSPSSQQKWDTFQQISTATYVQCYQVLHSINESISKENLKVSSVDWRPKLFKSKDPKLSRPTTSSTWLQHDLNHHIKDLVGYRLAFQTLYDLHKYLTYGFIASTEKIRIKASVERLRFQVCQCILSPSSFDAIDVPSEQNWQTWSDHPDRDSNVVLLRVTKRVYELYEWVWPDAEFDVNADGNGEPPNADVRDSSQVPSTSFDTAAITRPLPTAAVSQSSDISNPPRAMTENKGSHSVAHSITVSGVDLGGSGNGDPDTDSDSFVQTNEIPSGSAAMSTSSPSFDLGQQIQFLLQQQLVQDQKDKNTLQQRVLDLEKQCKEAEQQASGEKIVLMQRVLQLEKRCEIAEQKAEDEQNRAEEFAYKSELAEESAHYQFQRLKEQHLSEMQTLKEAHSPEMQALNGKLGCSLDQNARIKAEFQKDTAILQQKLHDAYLQVGICEEQTNHYQQKNNESVEALKHLKKQMLQIQEIAKTCKLEDD